MIKINSYTFDELEVGKMEKFNICIKNEDVEIFAKLTGDYNPLHVDKEFGKKSQFKKNIVQGLLVESYFSTLAGVYLPGKHSLILSVESNFKKPVYINEELEISGKIIQKLKFGNIIILKIIIINKKSKDILIEGKMKIKVLK